MSRHEINESRAVAYERLFGAGSEVSTELPIEPSSVAIDVCTYPPCNSKDGEDRDFYTLVTWGMSNRRMPNPLADPPYRAELILYCTQPTALYVEMLRWLAKIPFETPDAYFDFATTITNGQPPKPIFSNSALTSFVFLMPPLISDASIVDMLTIKGDPVMFLWVVPITNRERRLIESQGIDPFLDILDERQHSFLLDESRESYV